MNIDKHVSRIYVQARWLNRIRWTRYMNIIKNKMHYLQAFFCILI